MSRWAQVIDLVRIGVAKVPLLRRLYCWVQQPVVVLVGDAIAISSQMGMLALASSPSIRWIGSSQQRS